MNQLMPALFMFLIFPANLWADVFYRVPLAQLELTDGAWPEPAVLRNSWWRAQQGITQPVALDGEGEAFLTGPVEEVLAAGSAQNRMAVLVRTAAAREVTGMLILPATGDREGHRLRFRIPAEAAVPSQAKTDPQAGSTKAVQEAPRSHEFLFQQARAQHYSRLLGRNLPGQAWFREQINDAQKELQRLSNPQTVQSLSWQWNGRPQNRDSEFERTMSLFSGGRAISENLQLDRELILPRAGGQTLVPVKNISGITIREFDWQPLLKDRKPDLDLLASRIPPDQYAAFFPSFAAMMAVRDTLAEQLREWDQFTGSGTLIEQYQQQLGLNLDGVTRLLGRQLIRRTAITGSDPYFASGTDVALLMETDNAALLSQALQTRIIGRASGLKDVQTQALEFDDFKATAWTTPDRRLSSYLAVMGNIVVLTNSPVELQRLADVAAGKEAPLGTINEYRFFRDRYPLSDPQEAMLLLFGDAAIRRLCGPRWRIASSRRVRAAAVMTDWAARHLDALVHGRPAKPLDAELMPLTGEMIVTESGLHSQLMGRPGFLTPIAELPLDEVTLAEKQAYERWRDGYQRNWSAVFDPIALRISMTDDRLSADLTVLPLIAATEYREMVDLTRGAKLKPEAGDPHSSLAHLVMALNPESAFFQDANRRPLGSGLAGPLRWLERAFGPLTWVGDSASLFVDPDPVWQELAAAKDDSERLNILFARKFNLPIGLTVAVRDPVKATAFLVGARGYFESTLPGGTRWEVVKHQEQAYVRIASGQAGLFGIQIYYGLIGDQLLVTLSEGVIQRAIERFVARRDGRPVEGQAPWLSEHVGLQLDRRIIELLAVFGRVSLHDEVQQQAWSALPILTEWKRRYPDHDPVALYRRWFDTELLCPDDARYVWNADWRTMETSLHGHPGQPREFPAKAPLAEFQRLNFGLTFEHDGLRARLDLIKAPAEPDTVEPPATKAPD